MPLAPFHFSNPLANHPPSYVRRKQYRMGRVLGTGTFGIVRLATCKKSNLPVAMKIIPKAIVKDNPHLIDSEISAVKELAGHPNIATFYESFESKDKVYMAFQPAMGGEVFEHVLHTGRLTEANAAHVVQSVASALEYIHSHGFVHRDVKPENLMFLTPPDQDANARIVLVDFGVAQLVEDGHEMRELAGSLGYAAPEVVERKPYGREIDMWSLGAVAFVMLSGRMPYQTTTADELLAEMRAGPVKFDGKYWDDISDGAKDFIRRCMHLDAEQRLTAKQALHHTWIMGEQTKGSTWSSAETLPNLASNLQDNYPRIRTRIPTADLPRSELISSDEDEDPSSIAHFSDIDKLSSTPASSHASPTEPVDPYLTPVSAPASEPHSRIHTMVDAPLPHAGTLQTGTSSPTDSPQISAESTGKMPNLAGLNLTETTLAKTNDSPHMRHSLNPAKSLVDGLRNMFSNSPPGMSKAKAT